MPKRRSDDPYVYLKSKIKKLERKILRGTRRTIDSSSSLDSPSPPRRSRTKDRPETKGRRRIRTPATSSDETDGGNNSPSQPVEPPSPMSSRSSSPEPRGPTVDAAAADAAAHAAAAPQVAAAAAPPPAAPSTSAAPTNAAAPSGSAAPATSAVPTEASTANAPSVEAELDPELLEILGIDPTKAAKYGKEIQKDLAVRLEHFVTSGMTKEVRKELADKYLIPSNCKLLDSPSLNPEIKAALTDFVAKRDKAIEARQKMLGTAMSALSDAITLLLTANEKNSTLTRLLMDACRILSDCQYNDSTTRRNYILSSLKKDMKDQLQNTKVDTLLFGQNLPETLKTARAINKSGAELKAYVPASKSTPNKRNVPSTSKNWRGPNLARKQTTQAPKTTPAPQTKTPRYGSSKQLQNRRSERNRR